MLRQAVGFMQRHMISPSLTNARHALRARIPAIAGLIAGVAAATVSVTPAPAFMPSAKPESGQLPAAQPRPKPDQAQATPATTEKAAAKTAPDAISRLLADTTPVPEAKPDANAVASTGPIDLRKPLAYAPTTAQPPQVKSAPAAPRITGKSAPASTGSTRDLETALSALGKGDAGTAMQVRNRMAPSLDRRIIDWKLVVSGDPVVPTRFIADFAREAPHWPSAELFRSRAEIAFYREKPSAAQVVREYGADGPITLTGKLMYARALSDTGQTGAAATIVRELWRTELLSDSLEKSILGDFAKQLRHADHRWRVEMLLYRERTKDAERNARFLKSDEKAYVKARIAVIRRDKKAAKLMGAVPRSMRSDAGYVFAQIQLLRRANKDKDAIALMLKAPTKRAEIVDGDEWWIERRLQSRAALDLGDARSAYMIAASHAAEGEAKYAEAEFHAGWFALRYLGDPRRAEPHFSNILKVATTPITSSRAYYWLGRTAEARGDGSLAAQHYRRAAAYPTAFYGQLALEKLGTGAPAVAAPRKPSAAERQAFDGNELVRAIKRMAAADRLGDTSQLFRQLGMTLGSQGEVALAVELAESYGRHQWALMVGKLAAQENNDVAALAFPTAAIPSKARIDKAVEKPVIYAIARQESAFNPGAVSHAGARGLLQLMPATAQRTAKKAGMSYSKAKLTSDPAYNATLGAAHLGELIDEFDGSYIMTFAAYNAGSSRVREWIQRFGDPRSPKVDPVDWIERIPFTETRNYVQRITENLQVYRARLAGQRLTIARDLKRGGG